MRVVFFGSGAFGIPVLDRLLNEHEVALVVSQPDRPSGRNRRNRPTEIAQCASNHGIRIIKPQEANDSDVIREISHIAADAFVVIAFGQKLGPDMIQRRASKFVFVGLVGAGSGRQVTADAAEAFV